MAAVLSCGRCWQWLGAAPCWRFAGKLARPGRDRTPPPQVLLPPPEIGPVDHRTTHRSPLIDRCTTFSAGGKKLATKLLNRFLKVVAAIEVEGAEILDPVMALGRSVLYLRSAGCVAGFWKQCDWLTLPRTHWDICSLRVSAPTVSCFLCFCPKPSGDQQSR